MTHPPAQSHAIVCVGLCKKYGRKSALNGLDLVVPQGMIFGFLGPNGAGKTTTIRLLLGLMKPTSGRATALGVNCYWNSPRLRSQVGYLPGDVRYYNRMTGRQVVHYLSSLRRIPCRDRAEELAGQLDLDLGKRIRSYSKGMRQKLGIVQAMMHQPRLLILDEPTSSLDPLVQRQFYTILKEYTADGQRTVFFSSHIISEVERVCDRVAILREGTLVADDTIGQLRRRGRQRLQVVFSSQADMPQQVPDFLTRLEDDGLRQLYAVQGDWQRAIDWVSSQQYDHIAPLPPNLEDVFLSFYLTDDVASASGNAAAPASRNNTP